MKYYRGWQKDVELKTWQKYWRWFWIGRAFSVRGDIAAEAQDRKFYKRWGGK